MREKVIHMLNVILTFGHLVKCNYSSFYLDFVHSFSSHQRIIIQVDVGVDLDPLLGKLITADNKNIKIISSQYLTVEDINSTIGSMQDQYVIVMLCSSSQLIEAISLQLRNNFLALRDQLWLIQGERLIMEL